MLAPKLRHFLLGCVLLAPSAASAEPLYVTITKFFTPLDEVGSSVTVITEDELESREVRTLPEALKSVPGMAIVQSGPSGAVTSVFMRGANSNQVLVLINGRPVGDPSSGSFAWQHLPLTSVERIEVLRGPASALYGSRAIGGVINIVTRNGQGPVKVAGMAEIGTRSTQNLNAGVSGEVEGIGFDFTLARNKTNGFSITPERLRGADDDEADSYKNLSASLSLNTQLTENLSARAYASVVDSEFETDGIAAENYLSHEDARTYFFDASLSGNYWDGLWRPTLSVSYSNYDRFDTNGASDSNFDGARWGVELQNDIALNQRNSLILGGIVESETMGFDTPFENFDTDRTTWGTYAIHKFSLDQGFNVNSAARFDSIGDAGSAFTFSVTPLWKIAETGTTLKGSVGTAFKAPSLYDLYGVADYGFGFTYMGNPNLDPERSFSWEVGVEQQLFDNRVTLGATYFRNDIRDAVIYTSDMASSTVNNQNIFVQGLEAFVELRPAPSVLLRGDYTYTDSELDGTGGKQALRRPRHKASVAMFWDLDDNWQLNSTVTYVGSQRDVDVTSFTGETLHTSSYTLVDVAVSYDVNENFSVFARASNLLDDEYEPADGFAGPGMQLFIGVKASY